MGALLLVGGILLVVGLATASAVAALVFWIVLLPFRLLFLALKLVFAAVAGVVGLGLFLAIGALGAVALSLALVVPLLPILLVVGAIWLLVRSNRRTVRV